MNPDMFTIGGFTLKWYSFLILMGVIVAFIVAIFEEKRKGFPKDFTLDLGFWLVLIGIAGARAYYVLFNLDYYLANPDQILAVWNGGLAIHGGIIAGAITLFVFCKYKNVSVIKTCDLVAPSLIIAQAVGRWGNFFNSEAHGPITTLEHLQNMFIPEFVINGMNINGHYYIPTFFYESLWCLLGFIILMILRYVLKKYNKGLLTSIYLIWYGIGRLCIESLRTDSLMLGNIKIAQLVSILFVIVGVGILVYSIVNYYKENKLEKEEIEKNKRRKIKKAS